MAGGELVSKVESSPADVLFTTRISASTTIGNNDEHVSVDSSGGAVTVTLPSTPFDGQTHLIKRHGGNTVTVDGNGRNIDDVSSFLLVFDDEWIGVRFVEETNAWEVVA